METPPDRGQNVDESPRVSETPNDGPAAIRIEGFDDKVEEPENQASVETQRRFYQERPAAIEERNGEIEFRVVNNDGYRESTFILTGLKNLFQAQLPKMPKDYIARLVYDRTHVSLALVKKPFQVLGGIAFRPFKDKKFAEIVFCAVSADHQVKGYGAHLMAHLKDYVKASSPIMHFLTYADNQAIGYFKKQGFTKDITLPKPDWVAYIKDYEGGTLMQCTMLPRISYLKVGYMLFKQKEVIKAKIRASTNNHVVHDPPKQWANGIIPIDPLSIPAIAATGWTPEMEEMAKLPRHGPPFAELEHFLDQITNHPQAWPFSKPVSKDEVPDYYDVIKSPMDLSTMAQRLEEDYYTTPKDMLDDLDLMFSNCRKYNHPKTIYHKCATQLEKFMWRLIEKDSNWHHLFET